MNNTLTKLFTPDDLARIEKAVKEAELQTGGEIVPYVVQASDAYEHALWRAGSLFGAVAFLGFLLIYHLTELSWMPFVAAELAVVTGAGALGGVLLTMYVPTVKRFFAGNNAMDLRTKQRAADAFLAEEIFDTRDRTGILIFLSLMEHKVLVLGDSGINAKVQQTEWEEIVKNIVDGMRRGTPASALVEAIRQCGDLLQKHGVARRPDDTDELRDQLRTG